jgi:DNA-binding NarL/FixJ family response regulator
MPETANRSARATIETADPLRRVLVVVASAGSIPECFFSAMEREFPWISIEHAESLGRACAEFDHPVSLILVDEALLADIAARAGEIARKHPGANVAVISHDGSSRANIVEDILATKPVRGVLPMNLRLDIWLSVIRLMLRGGEYFPPSFFQKRAQVEAGYNGRPRRADDVGHRNLDGLTGREKQVLEMVSHGCQNKLIAAKLELSEHTIKVHIHNIIKKLGAQNRTAAAAIFLDANGSRTGEFPLFLGR